MLTAPVPFLFSTVAMKIRNLYLERMSKFHPSIGITEAAALVTGYLQRMVIFHLKYTKNISEFLLAQ
ncbi:hypothetical protein GGU45_000233 [Niabella hirudinis]